MRYKTKNNIFDNLVSQVAQIGLKEHAGNIVKLAKANATHSAQSINKVWMRMRAQTKSCIVINAGPSLKRQNTIQQIVKFGYTGTTIAVDGSYIACLKRGLIPDYVVTMDPHPTRPLCWFGDPDYEKHTKNDDYFKRQDLNTDFRDNGIANNLENIQLANSHAYKTIVLVSSTTNPCLTARLQQAGFPMYWWNPLVDNPHNASSITRALYNINKLPSINTGGNVGTAAWVIAHTKLNIPMVALTGTDFGYYADTPIENTQTYYELLKHVARDDIQQCFTDFEFPLNGEKFYCDPTYYWYRQNFIELSKQADCKTYNCTEGGTLYGENIECIKLTDFINQNQKS